MYRWIVTETLCCRIRSPLHTLISSRRTRCIRCIELTLSSLRACWRQMDSKWLRATTGMLCGRQEASTLTSTRSCKSTKRLTTSPTRLSWRAKIDWSPTWSRCKKGLAKKNSISFLTAIFCPMNSQISIVISTTSKIRNNRTSGSSNHKIPHKGKAFTSWVKHSFTLWVL